MFGNPSPRLKLLSRIDVEDAVEARATHDLAICPVVSGK
jgi:hypothetical protein